MTQEELLQELESLVSAMEESLSIITGAISEISGPKRVLMNLVAASQVMRQTHGLNEWRDRLMRSPLRIAALKARPLAANDPELQTLISSVLGDQKPTDRPH